ncbi:MAG: hypothetical protein FJ286_13705 [Planctomycetes bacterium]|nr:hypothetical protein [Planctomycetota bacterium]
MTSTAFRFIALVTARACLLALVASLALPPTLAADPAEDEHGDHEHGVGLHGGLIVPLGRDSYHIEPVFEADGVLRLYLLGSDETRIHETQRQTLTAYVKPAGGRETVSMQIAADPQEGDADDKTSRFTGTLPESLRGIQVDVTIPNLRIEGERFRVGFTSAPPPEHAAMPAALADDESAKLFLTPGGKYTEADIAANGRLTAMRKFKGFQAKHDANPKPGDRLCPISETKANPLCAWVIGGKTYEFCCPPCVEEFVRMAKETPDDVKDPEAYVKR